MHFLNILSRCCSLDLAYKGACFDFDFFILFLISTYFQELVEIQFIYFY